MIAQPPLPPSQNGHAPIEDLPAAGDPLDYVSVSRLKSYLGCSLRFYFEKVMGLRRPLSPSLHFGRAVHAGLQYYNLARWRDGDMSEPAVVAAYQKAFDHPEPGQAVSFDTDEDRSDLRAKGEPLLRAFLATQLIAPEIRPAGVELHLRAELPSLALPLLGVIDLIKANHCTVDYKTIAATPDLNLETWLHDLQITAYTLLVEDATGEQSPGNEIVFLVKTKTPKVIVHAVPPPRQVQRDRFARLVEIYANGVANEDYHPSPGPSCAWCSYRSECSAWKGDQL